MLRSAVIGAVLLLGAVVPSAAQTTRTDLLDKEASRAGGVIVDERSGRVDFYDNHANRIGYGHLDRASGRIEVFDTRGNRVGSGILTPNGDVIRERR
jgi:hypothetical protein